MVLRIHDGPVGSLGEVLLSGTGYLRQLIELCLQIPQEIVLRHAHLGQQLLDEAVLHGHKAVEKMQLLDLLISLIHGQFLTIVDGFY